MIIGNLTSKLRPYFYSADGTESLWPVEELLQEPSIKQIINSLGNSSNYIPNPSYKICEEAFVEVDGTHSDSGSNLIEIYGEGTSKEKRSLRRYLTEASNDGGINYSQAIELNTLLNNGFNLIGINKDNGGVWSNVNTARNMFYVALDKAAPELKEKREEYLNLKIRIDKNPFVSLAEIKRLSELTEDIADLIREKILGKPGGGIKFIKDSRLISLVTYQRDFLASMSFGSLLRSFLPGIIDEYNEFALMPHEVEDYWLEDKEYEKRQLIRALSNFPGMKELLNDYMVLKEKEKVGSLKNGDKQSLNIVIGEISSIVRSEILKKLGGGKEFVDKIGVHKKHGLGAILRDALPGIVDENNTFAIQPHELESFWWQEEDYAKIQFLKALNKIEGMEELLEGYFLLKEEERKLKESDTNAELSQTDKDILDTITAEISKIIRSEILDKAGSGKKFIEDSKLKGLTPVKRDFLNDKTNSLGALLRAFLPGVIDENKEKEFALQPHEVESDWWDDENYAKRQFFKALSKLPEMKELLAEYSRLKEKERMLKEDNSDAELTHTDMQALSGIISKISDIKDRKFSEPNSGTKFIKDSGLYGLTTKRTAKRTFLDKLNSIGSLFRAFIPELKEKSAVLA